MYTFIYNLNSKNLNRRKEELIIFQDLLIFPITLWMKKKKKKKKKKEKERNENSTNYKNSPQG